MVYSSKFTVIADGKHQIVLGLALGKTIHFGSLEFIAERIDDLSLFAKGDSSGTIFMGMAHKGTPLLHTILEDSTTEFDTVSSGGSPGRPIYLKRSTVTPSVPITIMPPSKGT
jgi:hypothetical protein